jgi:hypothetical protein
MRWIIPVSAIRQPAKKQNQKYHVRQAALPVGPPNGR